jgi:adenosine deaminase
MAAILPMTQPTLDHNGQIALALAISGNSEPRTLDLNIDLSNLSEPAKLGGGEGHFQQGLRLVVDGEELNHTPFLNASDHVLTFSEVPLKAAAQQITLTLYGQPVFEWQRDAERYIPAARNVNLRLSVDELRMLANYEVRPNHLPIPRNKFEGFDPKKHASISDLHTHSSAQLNAQDLFQMALVHKLSYPMELLEKIGITLNKEERAAVSKDGGRGMRFSPCEAEGLACEKQNEPCDVIPLHALTPQHRQQLQQKFHIPQDVTMCFSDFDREYYRFVNPLVKNPEITKDMILRIAREYQKNGVRYAELSTAAMLNLDAEGKASWFSEMVAAVREAETETGVRLRFLVGIPRSYTPAKVMAEIEKIKYAARHPLVVGVDLLGYEANRTSDFSAALSHLASWASAPEGTDLTLGQGWDFKRDFTIRVHAGETSKNSGNVAEAIRIAEKFGVRVRIAHAIREAENTELDEKIRNLSSQNPPLVSLELCPSSNLAYSNIHDLREVPFTRWLGCCESVFLGSDGAGAIQTNPQQLALAALAGGASLKQLEAMRENEERFIVHQQQCDALKVSAFNACYGQQADAEFLKECAAHIAQVQQMTDPKTLDPIRPKLPLRFAEKTPILVAGASKESLDNVDEKTQAQIKAALQELIRHLDPEKTFFVVGRSKNEGVTATLDKELLAYNAHHPERKFEVLALTTEDTTDLAESISWVVPQKGMRDQVPDNIINFMQHHPVSGISLFIGGGAFTNAMIKKCRDVHLPYLVMENVKGASADNAKQVKPDHHFNNGPSLRARIQEVFARASNSPLRAAGQPQVTVQAGQLERDKITAPTSKQV